MKKTITTLVLVLFSASITYAIDTTPDSMYVHFTSSTGADSIAVHAIADVDSIVYYAPEIVEPTSGTFTDSRDSHVYNWVTIGEQTWMAENLAYLPKVHTLSSFMRTEDPRYAVYGYEGTDVTEAKNSSNYTTFGVLYSGYAALAGSDESGTNPSGVQGICPTGWHLPSAAEWEQLVAAIPGENKVAQLSGNSTLWEDGVLKQATEFGTSGFDALPGGERSDMMLEVMEFYINEQFFLWLSGNATEGKNDRKSVVISNGNATESSYTNVGLTSGMSVRCIRD